MTVVRARFQRWRVGGHAAVLGLIIASLSPGCAPSPDPIVTESHDWGKQNDKKQNSGHWRRVTVRAPEPAKTLVLTLDDLKPKNGKVAFTARVDVDCDILFERQEWVKGKRLVTVEAKETRR